MKLQKLPVIAAICCGSIPPGGWLVSIPWNLWIAGEPFTVTGEWNNLPLWLVTFPLHRLASLPFGGSDTSTASSLAIVIYTALCAIVYTLIGAAVMLCIITLLNRFKKA